MNLFLATKDGLVTCEGEGLSWQILGRGLAGKRVTSVIAREGVVLAGTTSGVFRCEDPERGAGAAWEPAGQGLDLPHVRWLAYHPQVSDLEFAGTEPAGIFVSHDGARSWRACPEVAGLRDAHGWYLPYSPAAGCVRGFAFHGKRAYAAAEVGGVLRSDDGGESWRLAGGSRGDPDQYPSNAETFVHPDVHSIVVHSGSPDRVCAPTGGGFFLSTDGGEAWRSLYRCYCRAAWWDPDNPQHLLLGPADGVDRNGRIEASRDGGQTWSPASAGLQVPWRNHMVERFVPAGSALLAVLSNGELLGAQLETLIWQRIVPAAPGVLAVSIMAV